MHTMQLVCIINQHPRSRGDSRRRDKRNRDKSRGSSEFEVVDENRQRLDSNYGQLEILRDTRKGRGYDRLSFTSLELAYRLTQRLDK